MRSLRSRALFGGFVWAAVIVFVGGFALITYFGNATQRRFDNALLDRHLQVLVALNNSGGDPALISSFIPEPAYSRPYSGSYWQAAGPDDVFLTSRSLFDTYLPDPEEEASDIVFWEGEGPDELVRGVHQFVYLSDGSAWVVTVAESLETLYSEQAAIRQSLFSALGLIGVLGVGGAALLASVVSRPLAKLRQDVSHRWDSATALEPEDYPDEVAPLVEDINTLLVRNREIVDRARRQAADMAHALKTPSAILRNELEILQMSGTDISQARDALERIDAQLLRSLARMRAANTGAGFAERVDIRDSIDRLVRGFRKLHPDAEMKVMGPPELLAPIDTQDVQEVIGNLLENAFKYGRDKVQIVTWIDRDMAVFSVEDNGPGIPEEQRRQALRSGGRLDTSKPGTGLGLAIAADLLQAYGGYIRLEESEALGGLAVICAVPLKPVGMTRPAAA